VLEILKHDKIWRGQFALVSPIQIRPHVIYTHAVTGCDWGNPANHSAFSSDEMKSCTMRLDEIKWVIWMLLKGSFTPDVVCSGATQHHKTIQCTTPPHPVWKNLKAFSLYSDVRHSSMQLHLAHFLHAEFLPQYSSIIMIMSSQIIHITHNTRSKVFAAYLPNTVYSVIILE